MQQYTERHYRKLIIAIWLLTSLLFLFVARGAIADWKMGDPDDQLRLVQVRDWLAGQSWWDITQYRMNPPEGGPMHWSRLVDAPIATMIIMLRPFLGTALAEQWASAIVPLLTYGCILFAYAATANRLFGKANAVLATAAFFTILPAAMQIMPMRIDHHGWQLFCFFLASWALFDPKRSLASAAIVGFATALWIEISIEGLPFAILFMSVFGLRWLFASFDKMGTQGKNEQLPIALTCLTLTTCFLYLITEGIGQSVNYCDGLSPFHIGAFAAVSIVVVGAAFIGRDVSYSKSVYAKLIISAVAASCGLAVVLTSAPHCTGDAFAELDPLVRQYWYNRVPEGLPIWAVQLDFSIQQVFGFAFGLIGLSWVLLKSPLQTSEKIALAFLFIGSAFVGTFVSRTMVYAICLGGILVTPMVISTFAIPENRAGLAKRMAFRFLAILLLFPSIFGQNVMNWINAAQAISSPKAAVEQTAFEKLALACQRPKAFEKLNQLPSAQLMIGLDASPAVLQFTHHKVVATGHHRNQQAMADVIRTFTGTADDAKSAMQKRKVDYFVTCEDSFELRVYEMRTPRGFWAKLKQGETPGWLSREPDIGPFHIYRTDWTSR